MMKCREKAEEVSVSQNNTISDKAALAVFQHCSRHAHVCIQSMCVQQLVHPIFCDPQLTSK